MISVRRHPGAALPALGKSECRRMLALMLRALDCPQDMEVTLVLAGDAEISRLNQQHLDLGGPTNILSFPAGGGKGGGDLALSAPALRRECLLYGQDEREHFVRLLAHGLVHLLGHDHGASMDVLCEKAFAAALEKDVKQSCNKADGYI